MALAILPLGCGGSPGAGEEAKAPTSATAPAPDAPSAGDAGTSTTVALGDGGDLQGAQIATSSATAVETHSSDAGAAAGPHKQDPGRTPQDIKTIIGAHRDEARACYDTKGKPGSEGDLVVKWTIDPKGNVTDIAVDEARSQIRDPLVAQCIFDIVRKIKFSESAKGFETRANYPFNFRARPRPQAP